MELYIVGEIGKVRKEPHRESNDEHIQSSS